MRKERGTNKTPHKKTAHPTTPPPHCTLPYPTRAVAEDPDELEEAGVVGHVRAGGEGCPQVRPQEDHAPVGGWGWWGDSWGDWMARRHVYIRISRCSLYTTCIHMQTSTGFLVCRTSW